MFEQQEVTVGLRSGRLTVVEVRGKDVRCQCDCGEQVELRISHFTNVRPRKSCGCIKKERSANKRTKPVPFHKGPVKVGQRYGHLVVQSLETKPGTKRKRWVCTCDCGNSFTTTESRLLKRRHTSCGCARGTPGGSGKWPRLKLKERERWYGMLNRCYQPSYRGFHNYGGRGIKVCDRWRESFDAFLEDMGPLPTPDHQLDRIDCDGDYEPGNCRWATRKEQNRNRRNNRWIEYNGERRTLRGWAEHLGVSDGMIHDRLKRGLSVKEAFETPATERDLNRRDNEVLGKTYAQWEEETGIPWRTIHNRIHVSGWDPERAVSEPVYAPKIYEWRGEEKTLSELAEQEGVVITTAHDRINRGLSLEEALTPNLPEEVQRQRQERAKELISASGIMFKDIAALTGSRPETVARWGRGQGLPSEEHMAVLETLGTPESRLHAKLLEEGLLSEAWQDFDTFFEAVGAYPTNKHDLYRRDETKPYQEGNARWLTWGEQKRWLKKHKARYQGELKTLKEWSEHLGVEYFKLWYDITRRDRTMEEALADLSDSSKGVKRDLHLTPSRIDQQPGGTHE